jgi:hypothetical protein
VELTGHNPLFPTLEGLVNDEMIPLNWSKACNRKSSRLWVRKNVFATTEASKKS